ncbi:hypothetical protein KFL_000090040 [Klebsormidium nitens]|uniref:Intradiol ring-cleavage dioxygenases domain-containing protein n=1 Tax=Klebsormidium nitens TaxID=105231 RepID=A0A1Y1HQQ0_KLENI|nr:hypothetical protein KFL_000090040 [Klebsormidium nitens]|eukprot:GAQ78158.1 hypothetical protein KFL_000090040 [Klebsormidium nitens]
MGSRQRLSHVSPPGGLLLQRLSIFLLSLVLSSQTSLACSLARSLAESADDVTSCLLTPELVEGPYYLHNRLIRADISEGKPGIPFEFSVTVTDFTDCSPLANVFVDIWHCDALGLYSGYAKGSMEQVGQPDKNNLGHELPTDSDTYLRGTLVTDANGVATFKTIMPGWYEGRVTHIHTKIHVPYQKVWTDQLSAYEDSHVVHVGQFYFNDSFVSEVAKEAPYNTGTAFRTPLTKDNYYYVEIPVTEISLKGSKLSEGIVGKAEAIVYPYWETVKPETLSVASLTAAASAAATTAANLAAGSGSFTAQWFTLLIGAVGGIVIGAATVLSVLAYSGKLSAAGPAFVLLPPGAESEEAGLQMASKTVRAGPRYPPT